MPSQLTVAVPDREARVELMICAQAGLDPELVVLAMLRFKEVDASFNDEMASVNICPVTCVAATENAGESDKA